MFEFEYTYIHMKSDTSNILSTMNILIQNEILANFDTK
jgi:hypothetical protein